MNAGVIRVNMAHMSRVPVYSDNVRWVNNIYNADGVVATLDTRPYVDMLCEYGVFFTVKKS